MENVSNLFVCYILETKVVNKILDARILFLVGNGKFQACRESERLTNCETSKEYVFLLDISSIFGEGVFVNGDLIVEQDVTRDTSLIWDRNSVSQNIQERSFASTGGSHNEGGLSGETDTSCMIDDQSARIILTGCCLILCVVLNLDIKTNVLK